MCKKIAAKYAKLPTCASGIAFSAFYSVSGKYSEPLSVALVRVGCSGCSGTVRLVRPTW